MKRLAALALLAAAQAASALELNTATQAQLEAVRGLGVATTERLLDERAKAPFADWADLMRRVRGIKAANARRLSEAGLTVGGARYEAAAEAGAPASAGR